MKENIKLVILDVDGVMCDGKTYNARGEVVSKTFNDLDFTAIKRFKALGIPVVIVSSDTFNEGMARNRKIPFYNSRNDKHIIDKGRFADILAEQYNCKKEEMVYIGDDVFDCPLLHKVGFSFCPSNAPKYVKDRCRVILTGRSGQNLISEMFDRLVLTKYIDEPLYGDVLTLDSEEK